MTRLLLFFVSAMLIAAALPCSAGKRTRVAKRRIPKPARVESTELKKPKTIKHVVANAFGVDTISESPVDTVPIPEVCPEESMPTAVAPAVELIGSDIDGETAILGTSAISADIMYEFVRAQNADFNREIAEAFYNVGLRYGIRGDIALCQAILETGWFKFSNGTAVRPEQHNYCGLGVIKRGNKGHSFDSVELGVTAQIQHLYAYACTGKLPSGEKLIDPRFNLVSRGVAPTWQGLSNKWAANPKYCEHILNLYSQMSDFASR